MVVNKNKSSKPVIEIKEMHKWFGNFHVLKNISLGVNQGERIVICGPSGSGKSTLIRCINRLEAHQKGHIVVHGTELTNDLKNIESHIIKGVMNCAPGANAITKEIVLATRHLERSEMIDFAAKGFAERMLSDEGREGIASFIEKRKPKWSK